MSNPKPPPMTDTVSEYALKREAARPIVVGSTWHWKRSSYERVTVTSVDHSVHFHALPNGLPFSYLLAHFRDAMTWISNPAPASNVIRTGDLVPGKRYRIVEIAKNDPSPRHAIGDFVTCTKGFVNVGEISYRQISYYQDAFQCWWAYGGKSGATYVTAVELVEDEADIRRPCVKCGTLTLRSVGGLIGMSAIC